MKVSHYDSFYMTHKLFIVSLSGEYMDATLFMGTIWSDPRLAWKGDKFRNTHEIQVNPAKIWHPDLEFVNRIHDYSYQDEKIHKATVDSDGRVTWNRIVRIRANFEPNIDSYPYDEQSPVLKIASLDSISSTLKLTTTYWNSLHRIPLDSTKCDKDTINKNGDKAIMKQNQDLSFPYVQHERYMGNSEWNWFEYDYEITNDKSLIQNNKAFSTLGFNMKLRRNHPFYSLTLFVPMIVLTFLSPIGLILPGMNIQY